MKPVRLLLLAGLLPAVFCAGMASQHALRGDEKAAAPQVYELRTYVALPGRLDALHKRFREHTMPLFEKHGMTNVVYLTPEKSDNTLVYLVAHKSREAADASWAAFQKDPVWAKARDASEADGKIVMKVERQYLHPTDYSPLK